jgi:hypothetical protein
VAPASPKRRVLEFNENTIRLEEKQTDHGLLLLDRATTMRAREFDFAR